MGGRVSTLCGLTAALLVGCRSPKPSCDVDRVETVAHRLLGADPREQPDMLIAQLPSACRFPAAFAGYFELFDPQAQQSLQLSRMSDDELAARHAAMDHACPSAPGILPEIADLEADQRMPTLYDRCGFDRYGVLDRAAFLRSRHSPVPWALHQYMLDHGVSEGAAQVVTRALFAAERKYLDEPDIGLDRLPRVDAPLHERPEAIDVILSTEELRVLGHVVARLQDGELDDAVMQGKLIVPLAERLVIELRANLDQAERSGHGYIPRVHVEADARMPAVLVRSILDTAVRRGVDELGLIIESGVYEYGVLPMQPVGQAGSEDAALHVVVDDDGALELVVPERVSLGQDLAALRARAATLCADGPSTRPAVIEPSAYATYGRVVEVALVLRGPACGDRDSGPCCLPRLILE